MNNYHFDLHRNSCLTPRNPRSFTIPLQPSTCCFGNSECCSAHSNLMFHAILQVWYQQIHKQKFSQTSSQQHSSVKQRNSHLSLTLYFRVYLHKNENLQDFSVYFFWLIQCSKFWSDFLIGCSFFWQSPSLMKTCYFKFVLLLVCIFQDWIMTQIFLIFLSFPFWNYFYCLNSNSKNYFSIKSLLYCYFQSWFCS